MIISVERAPPPRPHSNKINEKIKGAERYSHSQSKACSTLCTIHEQELSIVYNAQHKACTGYIMGGGDMQDLPITKRHPCWVAN